MSSRRVTSYPDFFMVTAAFVTAASPRIGGGHVLRCDALAKAFMQQGVRCVLLAGRETRETVTLNSGDMAMVEAEPADCLTALMAHAPEIVVFDGYAIGSEIERQWRGRAIRVALDDLANRQHECELVIDSGPGRSPADYAGLVPHGCEVLAGPRHAPLRPAFVAARERALARRGSGTVHRLFVSMGYTDIEGVTRRVVEGALTAPTDWKIDVVTGKGAASLGWLRTDVPRERVSVHVDLDAAAMAELMVQADLAVGAGGGTALERCCLGLPSLIIVVADNQREGAAALERLGAARLIGDLAHVTPRHVAQTLQAFARQSGEVVECSRAAARTVDGKGAGRVADRALALLAAARSDGRLQGR